MGSQLSERFGARLIYDDATSLELTGDIKTITTGSGDIYRAQAVVPAMGSAYRKLGVDGESRLTGRGIVARPAVAVGCLRCWVELSTQWFSNHCMISAC